MSFVPTPVPGPDAPLKAALRYGLIGLGVLVVLAVAIATAVAGVPGLWGALLGAAIGGGFILTTAAVVLFGAKLPPTTAGMVMLASWVGKMLVALIVIAILNQFAFYDRIALFLTVVGALVIVLGAETYGVLRQKVPYVTVPDVPSDTATGE
ncbi:MULTISPECIES: hypothetical protein [Nocardia]|uniref:ATP synthase protein I n=2 Tax=Nocardia TaxID=1817 RepID=K0ER05_NOCB7|nr:MULTISPECIES: hypothetical protein [Nocardia]AFT99209.1 hypothetical protein O3I_006235 [Nocardia brasiliensis ATCC 700358]ASF09781.1 hypothetical protein CEQ30_23165 [Nocardia brasiliensis]KIA60806.1 membrane protein [Nocardia vulneris]MBF6125497.1 hypothetical protein [Nocardia brasiliensis]MBF6548958.1 hypothetical protein [Nocardia brasiliensis]